MTRTLITGPNFSGRSAALRELVTRGAFASQTFFIGPYAEAALSGLSSTIVDEIELYRAKSGAFRRSPFSRLDVAAWGHRRPQTLSGGEQVLLALHCFSLSAYGALAIDTALEQLDDTNRLATLDYLDPRRGQVAEVVLIDNRLPPPLVGWSATELPALSSDYSCDLARLAADTPARTAPPIATQALDFSYRNGKQIFRNVDVTLTPGRAYRIDGPNGAGKTTFLKLLVGVLAPTGGQIMLSGQPYRPWRNGNRVIALATQNPDHQWCGATLREDMARRRAALGRGEAAQDWSEPRLTTLAARLGIRSFDQHLYELPLAARKRLSWLWPFSGLMPWIVLDEPTVGQDLSTRLQLAAAMSAMCDLGYGIIFVTHDDDFAGRVAHQKLTIGEMKIAMT